MTAASETSDMNVCSAKFDELLQGLAAEGILLPFHNQRWVLGGEDNPYKEYFEKYGRMPEVSMEGVPYYVTAAEMRPQIKAIVADYLGNTAGAGVPFQDTAAKQQLNHILGLLRN